MRLVKPSYEIVEQQPGINGIYRAIESAGRTCYKSEDKITETSAKDFVDRMVKSGHGAMLEFGTIYLMAKTKEYVDSCGDVIYENPLVKYKDNPHSKVEIDNGENYCVSTNYRVLVEYNLLNDLKYLCEPTEYHEKRICIKFTTDRGVSHELVRHRVFSFAQESTRYCNYSKDKFGDEITYVIPSWCDLEEGRYNWHGFNYGCEDYWCGWMKGTEPRDVEQSSELGKTIVNRMKDYHWLLYSLESSEEAYLKLLDRAIKCRTNFLIKDKVTPQMARQVLPNALKTEINMCGFVSDWKHFFDLRDNKRAHPDIQQLAKPLHEEFIKRGYLSD